MKLKRVGFKSALFLLLWFASVFVGAFANSQALARLNPSSAGAAFYWSFVLSFFVAVLGVFTLWLLARQSRVPRNLGLFYLLFVALNVVFFGDRGTVSSVVFAIEFYKSALDA